jgi:hypothetical protein
MRTFAVIGLAALLTACNFRSENPGFAGVDREQTAAPTSTVTDGERTETEAREVGFRDGDRQVTATPVTTFTTASGTSNTTDRAVNSAPVRDESTTEVTP